MTETVVFRNGVAVPQEVVEVACVLDRSGSMQSIKSQLPPVETGGLRTAKQDKTVD